MRTLVFLLALASSTSLHPLDLLAQAPASSPLAIQHASIVDVRTGTSIPDQTVVVEFGRIVRVGAANSVRPPAAATIVDGRGKYLIPGLWDMHVHAAWPGLDALFAPLLVANGVTGVREMYGDKNVIAGWKKHYDAGEPWPRMIGAGHILDGPKPFWPGSTVATNADEARRAVDALKEGGADFIKVYTKLPRDAYFAALEEAKRVGIDVVGHVPDAVSVSEASDHGQRSIEHLTGVTLECSKDADALRAERVTAMNDTSASLLAVYSSQSPRILASQDEARCAALVKLLARNRTWQVPTLVQLRGFAYLDDSTLTNDSRVRYVPEEVVKSWDWRSDFRFRSRTPDDWANAKRQYRRQLEVLGEMHRGGVPILAGTDLLNPYTFPGFSLHDELVLLVEAGLSAADALRAATLNPAVFLGTEKTAGSVEKGKNADLVLLDANPLDDIHNTQKVQAVVLNGRLYDRAQLDAMIAERERKISPQH